MSDAVDDYSIGGPHFEATPDELAMHIDDIADEMVSENTTRNGLQAGADDLRKLAEFVRGLSVAPKGVVLRFPGMPTDRA